MEPPPPPPGSMKTETHQFYEVNEYVFHVFAVVQCVCYVNQAFGQLLRISTKSFIATAIFSSLAEIHTLNESLIISYILLFLLLMALKTSLKIIIQEWIKLFAWVLDFQELTFCDRRCTLGRAKS
jgi:hypothetical protein